MLRIGVGIGLSYGGGAGAASAHQQLLTLGQDEEWDGLYDPTNPDTRTLRDDSGTLFAAEYEDGLGTLPDLAQATEGSQLKHIEEAFGSLDAARGEDASAGTEIMQTSEFAAAWSQPNTLMTVHRIDGLPTSWDFVLFDGLDADHLQRLYVTTGGDYALHAGSLQDTGVAADTDPHVICVIFDGADSELWIDAVKVWTAPGTVGAHELNGLTFANRQQGSRGHFGPLGPMLLKNGRMSEAGIGRSFDVLHSLTGIAKG